ncbi:NAD(P)H-dependent FMN reductase [Paenibacillus sp. yr247]|uniref:NADPH-dependent FMN reductase n=1 Tax=Paenibacillus sp. yr247 TaxID=1761880 RepID=UPI000886D619|nr:NAD(P)H-dependent oxidoreductase [Paenibacillus sp. yr247]SDO40230.1 NAD(P)H-dependent FMN reductase [Paenibacillus sp. yr247]
MRTHLHFIGISLSRYKTSYDRLLLDAAGRLLPKDTTFEVRRVTTLPVFNDQYGIPECIYEIADTIKCSSGLYITIPNHIYTCSLTLTNMLGWLHALNDYPLMNKPVAVLGASKGSFKSFGGHKLIMSQLQYQGAVTLYRKEANIDQAAQKFDADGNLLNEASKFFIWKLMGELVELSQRLGSPLKLFHEEEAKL